MRPYHILLLLLSLLCISCAEKWSDYIYEHNGTRYTREDTESLLQKGMSKSEVIDIFGEPGDIITDEVDDFVLDQMYYNKDIDATFAPGAPKRQDVGFVVQVINGKVDKLVDEIKSCFASGYGSNDLHSYEILNDL